MYDKNKENKIIYNEK